MKIKAYIARDKGGGVYLYHKRPKKMAIGWFSVENDFTELQEEFLPKGINPQWDDKKPIAIEMDIKVLEK